MSSDYIRHSDEQLYEWELEGVVPPISGYPNIVVPANAHILKTIADITGCKICWWANSPPHSADSSPMVELDPDKYPGLWLHDVNQAWLMEWGGRAKLGHFTMYLDARTPREVFHAIERDLPQNESLVIDTVWGAASKHLSVIKWLYLPLSNEWDVAIFVTDIHSRGLVDLLEANCRTDGVPIGRVYVGEGGRETWRLDDGLK